MNYYQHHLGDYLRDTAHLSILEDGAYHRLLAAYYVREKPLPAELRECCKLARATSGQERKAVAYVLDQFFALQDDGYHQKRADEELAEYRVFIDKQRSNGKLGANKKWGSQRYANGHGTGDSGGDADGGSQTMASQSPSPNPQSPSKNPTPTPPKGGGTSKRRSERRAEQDDAQAAWAALLASKGAKRDARTQAAIDAVGGWPRIEQRETGVDSAIVRKAFCDAYRHAGSP